MEISVVDLDNSCRVCLVSDLSLETMIDCEISSFSLWEILKLCVLPNSISPKGSHLICSECKNQLKNFYAFRNAFLENEKYSKTWQDHKTATLYSSDKSKPEDCSDIQIKVKDEPNSNINESSSRITRASTKINTNKKSKVDSKSKSLTHECRHCNRSYKQIGSLKKHMLQHDPERGQFSCSVCNKRFPLNALLIRHTVIHSSLFEKSKIKSETGELLENQCLVCKSFVTSKNLLISHYRRHKDVMISCSVCAESFDQISDFIKHSKIHQENSIYKCFDCKLQFTVLEKLIDHLLIHQTNRPFECQTCNKSFVKKNKLEIHMESHGNIKDVLCPICGQFFRTKDILARHLFRHNGEKLISCTKCPMKFFFKYELVSHMLSHNGQKSHICEICGSAFSTNSSMRKHSKLHIKTEPNFECTYCNKKFSTNGILVKHVRIHTGQKNYVCSCCGKSFTQSGDMRKHTKIHLGKNIYKCELDNCDKAFEKHGQLKIHWTKDHFDPSFP